MKNIMKLLSVITLALFVSFTASACGSSESAVYDYTFEVIDETPDNPRPFNDINAVELVNGMRAGWNLGNTFDADGGETAWGNPITTKANVTALKDAGFNVIRIPVSWHNGIDGKFNIRKSWMTRITEVVNYAVDNDMYIILNTHHDERIFKFTEIEKAKSLYAFKKIWMQIAINFKDYDEKLIFEGLNEPRTIGSPAEWRGGTADEHRILNEYYQIFVDTVRAIGSNSNKRFLLLNTYAASAEALAMNGLALPADTAHNKLIVSYHSYSPYEFALRNDSGAVSTWSENSSSDKSAITGHIDRYYNKFAAQGIPVVIGEMGAMNRNNESDRTAWAQFYFGYAKEKGIPCIWWDNGVTTGTGERFGLFNRRANQFEYPAIVDAIMDATR